MRKLFSFCAKSNNRFIGVAQRAGYLTRADLKSNMDRFIATTIIATQSSLHNLKSNMDRFIVVKFAYI